MNSKSITTIPLQKLSKLKIIFITGLLFSCKSYDLTLNGKIVKTPTPLFTGYQIGDQNLSRCVAQAIVDNNIAHSFELENLNCSHAGIVSISGLEEFSNLRRVKLSHNELSDIKKPKHPKTEIKNPIEAALPIALLIV